MMRRLYVMPVPKGNLTHVSHTPSITHIDLHLPSLYIKLNVHWPVVVQSVGGFEDEDDMEDEDDEEQPMSGGSLFSYKSPARKASSDSASSRCISKTHLLI